MDFGRGSDLDLRASGAFNGGDGNDDVEQDIRGTFNGATETTVPALRLDPSSQLMRVVGRSVSRAGLLRHFSLATAPIGVRDVYVAIPAGSLNSPLAGPGPWDTCPA